MIRSSAEESPVNRVAGHAVQSQQPANRQPAILPFEEPRDSLFSAQTLTIGHKTEPFLTGRHAEVSATLCKVKKMDCLENEWFGLKIRRASALGGSTPPPGTILRRLCLRPKSPPAVMNGTADTATKRENRR
jgi:hypothetical protein